VLLLDRLKAYIQDPPPDLAVEISEAGLAGARLGAKTELGFAPLRPGTLAVSPVQENMIDPDEFSRAVRTLAGVETGRKRRDVALILPDYCSRIAVLDFDSFPGDAKEQASLIRFRLKRSVPFDAESAALSYWPEPAVAGKKKVDVLVAMAPLEVVSRYEAPFRAAGMNPGLVIPSSLAAIELAPESGLSVLAKLTGRVLTLVARQAGVPKLVRCLELPAPDLDEVAAVLAPTFVYLEDNLGGKADKLYLCGFGAQTDEAERRFAEELGAPVEAVRSPLAVPGESNAGLLGYLRSIARNN
jgi:type IV pilus assembly protein PilM